MRLNHAYPMVKKGQRYPLLGAVSVCGMDLYDGRIGNPEDYLTCQACEWHLRQMEEALGPGSINVTHIADDHVA